MSNEDHLADRHFQRVQAMDLANQLTKARQENILLRGTLADVQEWLQKNGSAIPGAQVIDKLIDTTLTLTEGR